MVTFNVCEILILALPDAAKSAWVLALCVLEFSVQSAFGIPGFFHCVFGGSIEALSSPSSLCFVGDRAFCFGCCGFAVLKPGPVFLWL